MISLKSSFYQNSLSGVIIQIAQHIRDEGGILLLVGGCVRDMILGELPKDFDIEVYGIEVQKVEKILTIYGDVFSVGRSFGILKVLIDGEYLDFSLPRKDSKVMSGHAGFSIEIDELLTFSEASKRRDFTINAILYNPLDDTIIDPHNGIHDIEKKILRVTDVDSFQDDPLRIFRAIRFLGRFQFQLDENSRHLLQRMIPMISELSLERIGDEWRKIFLQTKNLRMSISLMDQIGILDMYYPILVELKTVPQDIVWHPEGDVWTHTCMVVEQAQLISQRDNLSDEERLLFYFSALCHDFGKITHTQLQENGKITAYGHEEAGMIPAQDFLRKLHFPDLFIQKVSQLISQHVVPSIWYGDEFFRMTHITDGAFRRLAKKLSPATIYELSFLSEADNIGRGTINSYNNTTSERIFLPGHWIRGRSKDLGISHTVAIDIVTGKDLLELGFLSGPQIGQLIKLANIMHDDEGLDKQEILKRISGMRNNTV